MLTPRMDLRNCGCVDMPNSEQLRAEAKKPYSRARRIEDENQQLTVVLRALGLQTAAETQVIGAKPATDRAHMGAPIVANIDGH